MFSQLYAWNYFTPRAVKWPWLVPQHPSRWQMGLSLFSYSLSTTWNWLFEKVHVLRIISRPHTMELICSLVHQCTFISLFSMFSECPKRHFCTQKGSLAMEVCAGSRFQSSGQLLDCSWWCCLTPLSWFLGCDRGTRLKSSFYKLSSRQSSQFKLTSLLLSYSRPMFCI